MAASDLVPSSKRFIRQGDVAFNRINSEAVQYKIGGAVNFILERTYQKVDFQFNGVVFPGYDSTGRQVFKLNSQSTINGYYVNIMQTGTINTNIVINFDVYDNTGALRGTLFGDSGANRVLINGNGVNVQRLMFGRDLIAGTNFTVNLGSATRQLGELNFTTLDAGDVIIPKIVSGSKSAINLFVSFNIQEN